MFGFVCVLKCCSQASCSPVMADLSTASTIQNRLRLCTRLLFSRRNNFVVSHCDIMTLGVPDIFLPNTPLKYRMARAIASAWSKHLVEEFIPNSRSMSSRKLKFSSASLISLGILPLIVSSLVAGVVPVILDKTAHLRLSCPSVCRDLICTDTQLFARGLELLMPWIEKCVGDLDNLRRCTHVSVMKCDCDALSRTALYDIHRPELIWSSTIAVASYIWFCVLPLSEPFVFILQLCCLCNCRSIVICWSPVIWLNM